MRFKVLLSKLIITILLIAIFNSILFTSVKEVDPVMHNNPLTLNIYKVNLTILDELNEGGGAKDIQTFGEIAYVLSDSGLNIYNVTDPTNALELGHYYSDGYLGHSIAVYNNYVFTAADDKGLKIINVTDPSNPELANTYTSTRPAAIFIQNNLLFVANWENDFEIYNISSVPLIKELCRFKGDGFSYTYSSNDLAFGFANNGSFIILDVNNPEKIEKFGQIDDEEISCIVIDGIFWYTGGSSGIKVFNATKLSDPVVVSHFTETEASFITNLAVFEGFLYASDFHQGFRIFEISDSIYLSEIGSNEVGGSPLGFQVEGDIAYVASQISGIKIIKIQITEAETDSSTVNGSSTSNSSSERDNSGTSDEEAHFGPEVLLSIFILGLCSRIRDHRKKNESEK